MWGANYVEYVSQFLIQEEDEDSNRVICSEGSMLAGFLFSTVWPCLFIIPSHRYLDPKCKKVLLSFIQVVMLNNSAVSHHRQFLQHEMKFKDHSNRTSKYFLLYCPSKFQSLASNQYICKVQYAYYTLWMLLLPNSAIYFKFLVVTRIEK